MTGSFPNLENSLAKTTETGVLPVPPTYIFPTQIIGILNILVLVNFFFKKIKKRNVKDKGINKIEIKPIFLSQNFGLISIIK